VAKLRAHRTIFQVVSMGAFLTSKMRRALFTAVVISTVLGCAPGLQAKKLKVQAQYSKETDFSKFKTYAWIKHDAVAKPELSLEIMGAVDEELRARGLKQIEKDPDLLVTYYGGLDTDISIAANDPSYSNSGGVPAAGSSVWTASSIGGGPSSSVYVQKGTLIVDLLDSQAKKLTWRGIATGTLDTNSTKALEDIDKSVEKMFVEYPVKKR
jgi:hypothetical protein